MQEPLPDNTREVLLEAKEYLSDLIEVYEPKQMPDYNEHEDYIECVSKTIADIEDILKKHKPICDN